MGQYFLVVKKIKGRSYYYRQCSWRVGKKVKTHSVYLGPVGKYPRPIKIINPDYGVTNSSDKLRLFLEGKTASQIEKYNKVLNENAQYPTGVMARFAWIENMVKENHAFLGRSQEEKDYYDHLMSQAIHGAADAASPPPGT